MDKSHVVNGFFVPTDQEPSKPIEPTVTHLDNPTSWRMTVRSTRERQRCCLCGLLRNVGRERVGCGNLSACFRVIPAIQRQMSLFLCGWQRKSDNDPLQHRLQHFAVVTMGPTERDSEGNPFGIS